ncbi:MAG: hypothetical protein ACI9MR_003875, partial [Myxococcota bacterium]
MKHPVEVLGSSLSEELRGADFGDRRLSARAARVASAAEERPSFSFPRMTES